MEEVERFQERRADLRGASSLARLELVELDGDSRECGAMIAAAICLKPLRMVPSAIVCSWIQLASHFLRE